MDRPIVVLDTETAGCGGAPHLIEIGAVRLDSGEIFESFVRPQVTISAEATAIHGIRDEDVATAPLARDVLASFFEWVGEDWMAAHNAPFDARVIAFELHRAGIEPPESPVLDTLRLARKVIRDSPDHSLETLCAHLAFEPSAHHRALADAVNAARLLDACATRANAASAAGLIAAGATVTTIGAHSPRVVRQLKPRLRALADACEPRRERRSLLLVYGEDERPPARLEVVPQLLYSVRDRDYLEAECVASGLLKTYRLDRVQRVLA
jgi:DNA polymerase III epsilon subunit family exonuclease